MLVLCHPQIAPFVLHMLTRLGRLLNQREEDSLRQDPRPSRAEGSPRQAQLPSVDLRRQGARLGPYRRWRDPRHDRSRFREQEAW